MRATTPDQVMQTERWTFDREVTDAFDDMLARSIPQYEAMRAATTDVATHFMRSATPGAPARLVDLGSSRGEAVRPIVDRFGARARFTLTEVSEPMLDVLGESFAGYATPPADPIVDVREIDLRYEWPTTPPADVVTAVLTLLFTPLEFRQHIVQSAYDALRPGGALIVVEKLLPEGPTVDRIQTDLYYAMKAANGYSQEAIAAKREALQGVQVCLTDTWNRDLLARAGFAEIDCYWRWMQFAGYVAVKP